MPNETELNDNLFDNDVFDETDEKKEVLKKEDAIAELPEAYQVRGTDSQGREEIIDTFKVDRVRGITPIGKAKLKAQAMKRVFPKKTFYVVEIVHRIINTY